MFYKTIGKMSERRKKGDKGFSLVELLITVAIIAILAAIAIPIYNNQRTRASSATLQQDGRALVAEVASALAVSTNLGSTGANGTAASAGSAVATGLFNIPAATGGRTASVSFLTGAGGTVVPTGSAGVPATTLTLNLSSGTTVFSSGRAANADPTTATGDIWCFVLTNNGQRAAFTNRGLQSTSSTATCNTSGQVVP